MRRSFALGSALAVVAVAASVAAAAPTAATARTPTVTESPLSDFPNKVYVLTTPSKAKLTADQLSVTENGNPVDSLRVETPGATGSSKFGVVLLIDASKSMSGKPIQRAMSAARTFNERRNPGQQLSVITFNDRTEVVLPFTTSGAQIEDALSTTPELRTGTHIYDGLQAALDELRVEQISAGSIILLSDGKDVGSTVSPNDALAHLKDSKARVYSVGLKSPQFDPDALNAIAADSGGTFTVASDASQLERIYSALGYTLSNQYLVRYRSLLGPARKVHLVVKVSGFKGAANTTYVSPKLPGTTFAPFHRSTYDRVVQSTTTAALLIAALMLLIGLAVFSMLRQRDRSLERRLAQFITLPLEERAKARRADVTASLERERRAFSFSLRNLAWYARLEENVELARIDMRPSSIVGLTIVAGVLLGAVLAVILGTPWGLLLGFVTPFFTRMFVQFKLRRVRNQFAEQLPDNLDVLASALRAGHSFVGALSVAVDDSPEPSKGEFQRVIADEQLGVPLEDALRVTSARMANRDLIQVALVARLQRDAGTNAAEVLDQVSTNVRNRMEIWRLIRTLTAQGRMARWIVSLLPVFLFWAILTLNHDYLRPLWTTTLGEVAMVMAGLMIVTGSLVIKKIIEIEV